MPGMETAIERYRQEHKLTLRALAAKTGITSLGTLFRHCRGANISAEIAVRYHNALGIPLSDLRPDLWPPEPSSEQSYRQDGGGA